MSVTAWTWVVAAAGLALIALLFALQLVAVLRPRGRWTVRNVYGGDPSTTDPTAYFAFNQGFAWADTALLTPLQVTASVGMLLGERWGFVLGAGAAVPFLYSAILFFIWDRDLRFRRPTPGYWIVVWGIWPAYGLLEGAYCLTRLLS